MYFNKYTLHLERLNENVKSGDFYFHLQDPLCGLNDQETKIIFERCYAT